MFVITADQRDSRTNVDLVPEGVSLVERAAAGRLAVPVERNAGDELQALTGSAAAALEIGLSLLRDGRWSVGLGVGAVDTPVPADIRAARGSAFVLARDAVERAKGAIGRVAVSSPEPSPPRTRKRICGCSSTCAIAGRHPDGRSPTCSPRA